MYTIISCICGTSILYIDKCDKCDQQNHQTYNWEETLFQMVQIPIHSRSALHYFSLSDDLFAMCAFVGHDILKNH